MTNGAPFIYIINNGTFHLLHSFSYHAITYYAEKIKTFQSGTTSSAVDKIKANIPHCASVHFFIEFTVSRILTLDRFRIEKAGRGTAAEAHWGKAKAEPPHNSLHCI